jgi:hypothetical protein
MIENNITEYDLIGGIKRRRRRKKSNLFIYIIIFLFIIFLLYMFIPSNTDSTTNSTTDSNTDSNKEKVSSSQSNIKDGNTEEIKKYQNSGCIYDKLWKIKSKNVDDNLKYQMEFKNTFVKSKNGQWCLLPGYISGNGIENINWKYTDNPNDNDCMNNWTYYDNDGNVIEKNIKNITKLRDIKNWCPLRVYLSDQYNFKNNNVNLDELELIALGENKIWKYVN